MKREVVVEIGWGLGGLYKGVEWNDEQGGCDACNVASLQTCQNATCQLEEQIMSQTACHAIFCFWSYSFWSWHVSVKVKTW